MLLWVKSEAVNVNTISWGVGVVLIRLYVVEVSAFTSVKAIVTVELDESKLDWVAGSINENTEVSALVDTWIITSSTGIFHKVNWERDISYSEGGADNIDLNIINAFGIFTNKDISADLISKVVVTDLEGAGADP